VLQCFMIDEPARVAHDRGFPPFAEVIDGKSEGLAVDIFRAVAARAGVDVKFVPVSFEQRQCDWPSSTR
jgi:ABC-type amino acid transport substrate-binding protein